MGKEINKLGLEKDKEQMESYNEDELSWISSLNSKSSIDKKEIVEGRELSTRENKEYKRLKNH